MTDLHDLNNKFQEDPMKEPNKKHFKFLQWSAVLQSFA
jgi:hypothetical protein